MTDKKVDHPYIIGALIGYALAVFFGAAYIIATITVGVLHAYVATKWWDWLVAPETGLPTAPLVPVYAVFMIVSLMFQKPPKTDEFTWKSEWNRWSKSIARPLLFLLAGWLVHRYGVPFLGLWR